MNGTASWNEPLREALRSAIATLGESLPSELADGLVFETPPNPDMGDVAIPCFPLAKALRQGPPQIAAKLAETIQLPAPFLEAKPVGPYLNLYLDRAAVAMGLFMDPDSVLKVQPTGTKILLEHTSANPNGPLHVGRARNPILGDTLGRMHRLAGDDVHVQYYMDNLGRQVALLYWGRTHLDGTTLPPAQRDKPDHDLVRYYQAASDRMKADPETAETVKKLVAELEEAPPELVAGVRPVYLACFDGMRQSLERLGVHYDSIKDESDFVQDGSVTETIAKLKGLDMAGVEEDGANYLDMSDALKGNKSTKFFFTRKDGTSVYATRDVAYHAWKAQWVAENGPDAKLINVLGEDHRLQALQVRTALEALGLAAPRVIFYAFVSLPEGKMSTRMNRVVFLDDLLDQAHDFALEEVRKRRGDELDEARMVELAEAIGVAAVRFNIIKVQPEKQIKFQWEEALNFEGDSAPYIMYAYARACNILAKAQEAGIEVADLAAPTAAEIKLALQVNKLRGIFTEAARQEAPQMVAAYALELAGAIHEYYRDNVVIGCEDAALRSLRLRAFTVARDALGQVMDGLGLPKLQSM